MRNVILEMIDDKNKYHNELKKIANNRIEISKEEYDNECEAIRSNNNLSEISKTFYLSYIKCKYFIFHIWTFFRVIAYITNNRQSEINRHIFGEDYNTTPILYSDLYGLLLKLPQKEVNSILRYMNLSDITFNRISHALKNKSESEFISNLEAEKNDRSKTLKQLNFYYHLYCINELVLDPKYENKFDLKDLKNIEFDFYYDNNKYQEINQSIKNKLKDLDYFSYLMDECEKGYTNQIEDIIYNDHISPNFLTQFIKRIFTSFFDNIYLLLMRIDLSDEEISCINNSLYNGNPCEEFTKLAIRYSTMEDYKATIETKTSCDNIDIEFAIPGDFFSNKKYTLDSQEEEVLFSIDLTHLEEEKIINKTQALQKFINHIASIGYFHDDYHTKATFLYKITGRKLPNAQLTKIIWKDEKKNYNCLCFLIKYFYNDFIGISKGNLKSGLYNKAQDFFCIQNEIINCSGKAENIQNSKFFKLYSKYIKAYK